MKTVSLFDLQFVNNNVFLTFLLSVKEKTTYFLVFHAMMANSLLSCILYHNQVTHKMTTSRGKYGLEKTIAKELPERGLQQKGSHTKHRFRKDYCKRNVRKRSTYC